MSIPVLVQVYDEVRRLAIAGSAVAPGDFRLAKLVPPLAQAGEKAPVFARIAQAVQAVVDSNEKTAAVALLELTTLVNAVLYTQGETGMKGDWQPLATIDLGTSTTQTSARMLKPLLEALSSTGSGRQELIKDAFERGAFKDFRLVKPALGALDDPYPDISEFIAEKVLPLYGTAIVSQLRASLDLKGRGGHLHRLQLLHRLAPASSRDLLQAALSDGSKEMKVAAIECLGSSEEDLAYLLDQAKAKAKDVRAAALRALFNADVAATGVMDTLKKAIKGADLVLIIERVQQCPVPQIQEYVLQQAEEQLAALLSSTDKTQQGAAVTRLQQLISCLEGRAEPAAEAFLLKCFAHAREFAAIKSDPAGSDLNELVAEVLSHGTAAMRKQLVAANANLTGVMLTAALAAARTTLTPAAFYEEFSPQLRRLSARGKKQSAAVERAEILARILTSEQTHGVWRTWMVRGRYSTRTRASWPALDPRWLDAAVDAESVELVCRLARPDHDASARFLAAQVAKIKKPREGLDLLATMVRIKHPQAVDALLESLQKEAKETSHYYLGYWYGRVITDLPASAVPKLEALLPSLPEKMVDQLMESFLALKNRSA